MDKHIYTLNNFGKKQDNNTSSEQSLKNFDLSVLNTCSLSNKDVQERGLFLDKIRELAPICISKLARELKCSRSKLYYVLRDFQFAGLVDTKIVLDGNKAKRMVIIPDYKVARLQSAEKTKGESVSQKQSTPHNQELNVGDTNEQV